MNIDQKKRQLNSYAKYTGMGLQMMVIILIGVFSGFKLDQWLHTKPLLIIILSLLSVAISIYSVTRNLLKNK
jgi:F0F1-type ATP synthase assembly protein I